MKMKVTQDDIDTALEEVVNSRVSCCPISQAFMRAGYSNVKTWGTYIDFSKINGRDGLDHAVLPKEVRVFIEDFDLNYEVKPFEFEYEVNNA